MDTDTYAVEGVIDFSQAKALSALPAGPYRAIFQEGQYVPATSSGKPGYKFTFSITEPEEYAGRKAAATKSLQPHTLWAIKRWLVALGVPASALAQPMTREEFEDVCNSVLANECRLRLTNAEIDDPESETGKRTVHQVDAVMSAFTGA